MKVCFLIGKLGTGGIGNNIIKLSNVIPLYNIEMNLFVIHGKCDRINKLNKSIKVIYGNGSHLNSLFKIYKYIIEEKPDIVILSRLHTNILSTYVKLINKNIKTLIIYHTNHKAENKYNRYLKNTIKYMINRYISKKCDKIIAVSKGVGEQIKKDFKIKDSSKINIVYNPIWDSRNETKTSNVKHKFFDEDKKIIINIGRFIEQKDHKTLLKSFSLVRNIYDAKLIILGDGEKKEEIERMIQKLDLKDHVSLLGFVNNPHAYLSKSDLFVLSSKWEGFGNVIVEALGQGVPVVSTNCPFGPSEILKDGKYGNLVPVGDEKSMANAIINQLKHRDYNKHELINRAKCFEVNRIGKQYLEIFKELKNQYE